MREASDRRLIRTERLSCMRKDQGSTQEIAGESTRAGKEPLKRKSAAGLESLTGMRR
jgi:hypothetical protein